MLVYCLELIMFSVSRHVAVASVLTGRVSLFQERAMPQIAAWRHGRRESRSGIATLEQYISALRLAPCCKPFAGR